MRIQHIGLWVRDLEAMKVFYEETFGGHAGERYHNAKTGFSSYFIRFDEGAAIELMNRPDLGGSNAESFGYAHAAFALGGKEEVDELTSRLKAHGVPVVGGPRFTGDGCYESCILDPEGNHVEITCDKPV